MLERGENPLKTALRSYLDRREDWQVVFASEASVDALKLAQKSGCDGVLARVVTTQMAAVARKLSIPVVNISSYLEETGLPTVHRNDQGISQMCVRHLLEKSFSRIAVLQMPYSHWAYRVTEEEALKAIRASELPLTLSVHRLGSVPVQPADAQKLRAWLKSIERPFGLLLLDDITALDVLDACRLENLAIPKDVAIITTCGQSSIARKCSPSLTHAAPDGVSLVETACQYLEELIQSPDQPHRRITTPVPELVHGHSTDTLGVDDPLIAKAVNFLHHELHTGTNAADVVAHCQCSRRLIEQRFRSLMQMTLHSYIVRERVRRACEMIAANPAASLVDISQKTGFGDHRGFRIAFRDATGKNPSDWRSKTASKRPTRLEPKETSGSNRSIKTVTRYSMTERSAGSKRIAIIGWPICDHRSDPTKRVLAEYLETREDWEIVFAGKSSVDSFGLVGKYRCDGALAQIVTNEMAAAARRLPCPVVNVSSFLKNPEVPTVCRNDRDMGQMCVRHLLEKGFTRFGVVQAPHRDWLHTQTEAGVFDILEASLQKVSFSKHRISRPHEESETNHDLQAWLQTIRPPFGLVIIDDRCVVEVLNACSVLGLRIPEDVALITTGGQGLPASLLCPTITYVATDGELLVQTACEYLNELIKAPGRRCEKRVLPIARVVLGESTDTVAIEDPLLLQAVGIVKSCLSSGINAAEVSAQCKCSRRALENRFQGLVKTSLHEYIVGERIKRARLLIETNPHEKLTAIACGVGFASYRAFNNAFVATTNLSPAEWRRARLKCP